MSLHDGGNVGGGEAGVSLQSPTVAEPETDPPVLTVHCLAISHIILPVLRGGGRMLATWRAKRSLYLFGEALVSHPSICSEGDVSLEHGLHTVEERTLPRG